MFIFFSIEPNEPEPEVLSECDENDDESDHDDNNVISEPTTSKKGKKNILKAVEYFLLNY